MDETMRDKLYWPIDSAFISRKRKKLRRELLAQERTWTDVRVAILGGATTNDIQDFMELFLLAEGIRPSFYASEYGKYWEDGVFDNPELEAFKPQVIYVYTCSRNLPQLPDLDMDEAAIDALLEERTKHFHTLWDHIAETYQCTVIQNNFERPYFRLFGNSDISNVHGAANFIYRLNGMIYDYAQKHQNFFVHDLEYIASWYGLDRWHDLQAWNLYKSACDLNAGPYVAYSVTRIIKSVFGKNKKALALDLDNTMWGGIVGDDGADGLVMSPETAAGEGFRAFQQHLQRIRKLGVLLTVDSKNEMENAEAGLNHPDCLLKPDDFVLIKANWEPKDRNLRELASEIGIGVDSFVFIDDNSAEREIVHAQIPDVLAPPCPTPEENIRVLSQAGYFEVCALSADDRARNEMYQANINRKKQEQRFEDYSDYLKSLEMRATIGGYQPMFIPRIAQLTNKTNQFNLTTKRMSEAEITACAEDDSYIGLYGRLEDKFGDNGIVSVLLGKIQGAELHMELWLMSCRVLKRDMEYAMFDALVEECVKKS